MEGRGGGYGSWDFGNLYVAECPVNMPGNADN